jgi:hypothetical protein
MRGKDLTYPSREEGSGAGDETRTRDINLGKVALYQLSYTRVEEMCIVCRLSQSSRHNFISFPTDNVIPLAGQIYADDELLGDSHIGRAYVGE